MYKHWLLLQWGIRSSISWDNFKLHLRIGLPPSAFLSLPLLWFKLSLSRSTGSVTWSDQLCPISCSCPLPLQLSLRPAQIMKPILMLSSSKHLKLTWAGTGSFHAPPPKAGNPDEKQLVFLVLLSFNWNSSLIWFTSVLKKSLYQPVLVQRKGHWEGLKTGANAW